MLELHAPKFVIDSLYDNLGGLVEFLSAGLLAGLAAFLDELHQLLFLKFPREFALRIDLVVLFLAMRFLISFKDMLDNLITGATSALVACDC
jgi:hypothetical protein